MSTMFRVLALVLLCACHASPAVESPSTAEPRPQGSIEIPPDPVAEAPSAPREEPPAPAPTGSADTCAQPFVAGPCKALMPVFWYDLSTGRCESRNYGGCGGNDNRFKDEQACKQACGCPEGRARLQTCEQCGMAGGCDKPVVSCVKLCSKSEDCQGEPGPVCLDGKCVMPCR